MAFIIHPAAAACLSDGRAGENLGVRIKIDALHEARWECIVLQKLSHRCIEWESGEISCTVFVQPENPNINILKFAFLC